MLEYRVIKIKDLNLIKHLWEKLTVHHFSKSKNFSDFYTKFTFDQRMEYYIKKVLKGRDLIYTAYDPINDYYAGYCISSVDEFDIGEIDSFYVDENYRGHGIGHKLMEYSVKWLEDNRVKKIKLGVSAGNEEVFSFYEKYGFYPKVTILEKK